jgi:hypothetical protein
LAINQLYYDLVFSRKILPEATKEKNKNNHIFSTKPVEKFVEKMGSI